MSAERLRSGLEAFNSDEESFIQLCHPDVEFSPLTMRLVEDTAFRGHAGLRQFNRMRAEAWEHLRVELTAVAGRDDVAVGVGRLHGRGRASGIEVEMRLVWIARFKDGLVLRMDARPADDPAAVAAALAEAGLPPDALGP